MLLRLATCCLLTAPALAQTTWYVDLTGTPPGTGTLADPYTSIDYALNQPTTLSGDTVLVAPGTYVENVVFPGRGIQLIAELGAGVTTIDGGGTGSAVSFIGNDGTQALLSEFTVTGGTGTSPSATSGDEQGGGIYAKNAIVKVWDSFIEGNTAYEGGGVYAEGSDFDIRVSRVRDNTVTGLVCTGAGLMFNGGVNKVRRTIIENNVAGTSSVPGKGGGIYVAGGAVSVRRCAINNNRAELEGGGIWGGDEVAGSRLLRNVSQFGGAVYRTSVVRLSSLRENSADSASGSGHFGGGVYGPSLVTSCYIAGNTAFGQGAGAHSATLVKCTVELNTAFQSDTETAEGGGVANCDVTDSTLRFNSASGFFAAWGGGASQSGLTDCVVEGNDAQALFQADAAEGGGAYECAITDGVVVDNTTGGYGGGVFGGSTMFTEVVGNSAGWGGGAANADLERTTLFDNSATTGADGLHVAAFATSTVLDSILWLNGTSEIQVDGFGTLGVTYSDVLGGWPGTGNIDTDPVFWNPLTGDVHLQATSPCIDAGDPASPLDPDGSRADMGAYPFERAYSG